MVSAFTQRATGRFTAYFRPNTPHCGPKNSQFPESQEFGYEISIRYLPNSLDSQGFLLDNTWFRDYFKAFALSQVGVSCELLACVIADDLCRETHGRCISVTVTLEAIPGVTITCEATPDPIE